MAGTRILSLRHSEFVQNCEDILRKTSMVEIDGAALETFAATFKKSSFVPDWKDYVSTAANSDPYDIVRFFFEMAMIVANQGGFIYPEENGKPVPLEEALSFCVNPGGKNLPAQKWQIGGSGAAAMVQKMAEIRAAGALPHFDIGVDEVDARIGLLLQSVPFAEKRLEIFKEFADQGAYHKTKALLGSAYDGQKYIFDMAFVDRLAEAFPASFGGDPFLKKAILLPLMVSANAYHHGVKVDVSDLPVAADYVIPRVLNADRIGILKFDESLTGTLEAKVPLHENAMVVEVLRAAAVIACERLAEETGMESKDVDSNLWNAGRKIEGTRPHMMCYTMRF